ncbi:hypothetical protein ACVW0Y_001604 [Pseudomonas sp. TE3786]
MTKLAHAGEHRMDSKTQKLLKEFGSDVREQIARLYTISIIQTSALLDLATAVKNEKNVSRDTQVAAEKALKTIDELISSFDQAVAEIDNIAFDPTNHLGGADE